MALDYQLSDTTIRFPFYYADESNGSAETGADVRFTLIDIVNDSAILTRVNAIESSNVDGFYYYDWTHGTTVKGQFLVIVQERIQGNKFPVLGSLHFTINDSTQVIQNEVTTRTNAIEQNIIDAIDNSDGVAI